MHTPPGARSMLAVVGVDVLLLGDTSSRGACPCNMRVHGGHTVYTYEYTRADRTDKLRASTLPDAQYDK